MLAEDIHECKQTSFASIGPLMHSRLAEKAKEVKTVLEKEFEGVEELMKKHFAHQKAENSRLQQQITTLKV